MKYAHECIRLFFLIVLCLPFYLQAQVGINTDNSDPDPSAMLDVSSSSKGMLIPRMTSAQRATIPNPVAGLMIFNLDDSCFNYYSGQNWIKDCGRVYDHFHFPPQTMGSTNEDIGYGIATDNVGNSYVIGEFMGTVTFGDSTITSQGDEDVFVSKIDAAGNYLWTVRMGGNYSDQGRAIAVDNAGNVYATGSFLISGSFGSFNLNNTGPDSEEDVFVVKIDPDGQVLWARKGVGTEKDIGYGISTDAVGNSYVTGSFRSNVNFGGTQISTSSFGNIFVIKLNPTGQVQWAKGIGGNNTDRGYAISTDDNGNCFVSGYFTGTVTFGDTTLTSYGGTDIFVTKLDASGQILWTTKAGGIGFDYGYGIGTDGLGNSYMSGQISGMVTLGDTTLFSSGPRDIFVAKLDTSGKILWATKAGGGGTDYSYAISVDEQGNSYATGTFVNPAIFGDISLTGISNDVFVMKVSTEGQIVWASKGGGSLLDYGRGIAVNQSGRVFTTGNFTSTATFGDSVFTSAGNSDVFLWVLDKQSGTNSTVTLSDLEDMDTDPKNEIQQLTLNVHDLELTGGGTVDLSSYNQDLNFVGTNLSISDGNAVNLGSLQDNLGSHIATQNMELNGNWLSNDGGNEGLFVATDGDVGIGTDAPAEKLEVEGNTRMDADNAKLIFTSGSSSLNLRNTSEIRTNVNPPNAAGIIDPADNYMMFRVARNDNGANAEVMRLRGDGSVGIGTTSPQSFFHLDNPNQGDTTGIMLSSGAYNSLIYHTNGDLIIRKLGIPNQLVLDAGGNIGMGIDNPAHPLEMASGARATSSGIWAAASDSTRKYAIRDLEYGLAEVMAMHPTAYSYKSDSSASIGFIAQEIEQIIPEVVSGEEGNLGVAYGLLTSVLVNAIKEQQATIQSQKARIKTLEANQSSVESRLQTLEARLSEPK